MTLPRFRDLDLAMSYESKNDDMLNSFYVPVLSRAVSYIRSVGYFSSSAIAVAAKGVSHFISNGGSIKLLIGAQVYEEDRDALLGARIIEGSLATRLANALVPADEIARRRLEVLAWLAREGRLEVRVAVPTDSDGKPIVVKLGEKFPPYWHLKIGVMTDSVGDGIAFSGSVNESETGWTYNEEELTVFRSWDAGPPHYLDKSNRIMSQWSKERKGFKVYPLPEAALQQLLTLAPLSEPNARDPEEVEPRNVAALAVFISAAPRLSNSAALAEETIATTLQPHQEQVVTRLVDQYPRSWIVADEVGLGKTISSGLALRRLLLSGQVRHALILAPANVCQNWQNELFEKFGLWVPLLKDNKLFGAHPDDIRPLKRGENPFLAERLFIASSHLARLDQHADRIIDASKSEPYDLIIVDEAHHARRRANDIRERPNLMLSLLERIRQERATRALWLLTATPLQMHPLELFDLLLQVGLGKPFDDYSTFERYYVELSRRGNADWDWLNRVLKPLGPAIDPQEIAFIDRQRAKLGGANIERLRRFGMGAHHVDETVNHPDFNYQAKNELHAWLRLRGPVERHMTRHSRNTLREYISRGLISEPLAVRDVQSWSIAFNETEQSLYGQLNGFINRLIEAHGGNTRAGFVLKIYQRRLTSSWAAIERSLRDRLDRELLSLDPDEEDVTEDAGVAGDAEEVTIDQAQAVPLTISEEMEIREYISHLNRVQDGDSKYERLLDCIKEARSTGQRIIVFSQYTDTLMYLRWKLEGAYGAVMATFTGDGGRRFVKDSWEHISKEDLVDSLKLGNVQIMLATDAAAEGLNLQSCSYLVNYDMPWNPMKAEQRIGRIDRLGQKRPTVTIRNFFVSEAEIDVYRALAGRIDAFNMFIGGLPPILGIVEEGFVVRPYVEIDQESSDPLPQPVYPRPPLTYGQFVASVRDELGILLEAEGRAVTWSPDRASRDSENWRAMATYGHPELDLALRRLVPNKVEPPLVLAEDEQTGICVIGRSDRVPPEIVLRLEDLETLGEAIAAGQTEQLVTDELDLLVANRLVQYDAVTSNQKENTLEAIRSAYVRLVRDLVQLRMSLSKSEQGLIMAPEHAWEAILKQGGIVGYLGPIKKALGVTDAELFGVAFSDVRDLSSGRYFQRLQEREEDIRAICERVRKLRDVS